MCGKGSEHAVTNESVESLRLICIRTPKPRPSNKHDNTTCSTRSVGQEELVSMTLPMLHSLFET